MNANKESLMANWSSMSTILAALILLMGVACSDNLVDGGNDDDTGSQVDTGTATDTGTAIDTGMLTDAGTVTDTGTLADTGVADTGVTDTGITDTGVGMDTAVGMDTNTADTGGGLDTSQCPLGDVCNPIVVDQFPFFDSNDTSMSLASTINEYSCDDADEQGPEIWYIVEIPALGVLSVSVADGADVDIDVHILDGTAAENCLARGHHDASVVVSAGIYYIVADSWTDNGDVMSGAYDITIGYRALAVGSCAHEARELQMVWDSCGVGTGFEDRCDDGGANVLLSTPVTGPVVMEAHLVTPADDFDILDDTEPCDPEKTFCGWPGDQRQGLDTHYELSSALYVMERDEIWAPSEGGNIGQGSRGNNIPPLEQELWYVNMYWAGASRPDAGERLIIINPENGRAVIASGGWETGPGANTAVGGVTEEIHDYLGTGHRDLLTIGFAPSGVDLAYGPIDCELPE